MGDAVVDFHADRKHDRGGYGERDGNGHPSCEVSGHADKILLTGSRGEPSGNEKVAMRMTAAARGRDETVNKSLRNHEDGGAAPGEA